MSYDVDKFAEIRGFHDCQDSCSGLWPRKVRQVGAKRFALIFELHLQVFFYPEDIMACPLKDGTI